MCAWANEGRRVHVRGPKEKARFGVRSSLRCVVVVVGRPVPQGAREAGMGQGASLLDQFRLVPLSLG